MQWTFEDDNEEGEAVGFFVFFFFEKYTVFFCFFIHDVFFSFVI
jgi:hypothetical protein